MGETQYRILFETSADPIFVASPAGQMVDLNPAWLNLFGYSREAALQIALSDLFVESDDYARFWKKLNRNGAVKNFEGKFITHQGQAIECVLTTVARRDKQGQITAYQSIMRDVTEDKRVERQLKAYNWELEQKVAERTKQLETQVKQLASVNFITQMVASAHDTTTALETVAREMVHLFGVRSSGITLLNEARTELTVVAFYTQDQAEPSVIGAVIPLQGNLASAQVIESGKSIVIQNPQDSYLTKASHPILRERKIGWMMILPLLAKGQVIGTIGLDADQPGYSFSFDEVLLAEMLAAQLAGIIQNVRLFDEDMERAYQQLQDLDRLKSSFIGVITHELRSPFVAANLSIQLLYRYLEAGMYDELLDQIRRLDQEMVEGHQVINTLISFASLMSKQGDLFLEETDLAMLAQDATSHLARIVEARHIDLTYDFVADLPKVYIDQQRISEAIHHLVHNAIKFNKIGGAVKISGYATPSKIIFEVKDTGEGISHEMLGTIWSAFSQTADAVQRGLEGLGLGLALVKAAVEAHGGKVTVISKVGQGSTFGFWLPLTSPSASS